MALLNEAQFTKVWADATAKVKEQGGDREVSILTAAITGCIAKQVSEQSYVRANLEYDSDLPSCVKGKTRRELFNSIWASVMNQARVGIANATAQKVWGISFKGLRKIGFLGGYFATVEKESDHCKFTPDKELATWIKNNVDADKYSVKKGIYTIPLNTMLVIVEKRLGVSPDKHADFSVHYNALLDKFLGRRAERMTDEISAGIDEIDWSL